MRKALIIGYGNPLRSDDGVGQAVADALVREPTLQGAEIIACHQLTPELAVDLAAVACAVFIDVEAGPPAGDISITRLSPDPTPSPSMAHHIDPRYLLHLARTLYGRSPEASLVTIGAGSLDLGEDLSEPVATALPQVIAAVRRLALEA